MQPSRAMSSWVPAGQVLEGCGNGRVGLALPPASATSAASSAGNPGSSGRAWARLASRACGLRWRNLSPYATLSWAKRKTLAAGGCCCSRCLLCCLLQNHDVFLFVSLCIRHVLGVLGQLANEEAHRIRLGFWRCVWVRACGCVRVRNCGPARACVRVRADRDCGLARTSNFVINSRNVF